MFFLRNQKNNDKQPHRNFEADIARDAKQLESQQKMGLLIKKRVIVINK